MDFYTILKFAIVLVLFYFIKKLDIPDSYKFLLTIVPSILLVGTGYVIRLVQFAGKNPPLMLKRQDSVSDKPLVDEYFFESFVSPPPQQHVIEIPADAEATLVEPEKPFLIGTNYFDISNPANYILVRNLAPGSTNYTLEFWLRLQHVSNNGIVSFYNKDNESLCDILYDDKYLYINQSTKIPLTKDKDKWFHLVVMRGQADTLGTERGLVFINGIFHTYAPMLPNLQETAAIGLFKHAGPAQPLAFNKKYHDLANAALVRFYNRSLTIDEIQNNFLKDAYAFGLQEENMSATRTFVQGSNLMLYLDARRPAIENENENENDSGETSGETIYRPSSSKNKQNKQNSVVLRDIPLENNWLNGLEMKVKEKEKTAKTMKKEKKKEKKEQQSKLSQLLSSSSSSFSFSSKKSSKKSLKHNKDEMKTSKPIF